MMEVIIDFPPMFDEIDARFKVRGRGVIFAWGTRIFNPDRIDIPPSLMAHEAVHGERQLRADITDWWKHYIDDAAFRVQEELPAHQAEYRYLLEHAPNRTARRSALKQVSRRLSGPLYGGVISPARARHLIKGGTAA